MYSTSLFLSPPTGAHYTVSINQHQNSIFQAIAASQQEPLVTLAGTAHLLCKKQCSVHCEVVSWATLCLGYILIELHPEWVSQPYIITAYAMLAHVGATVQQQYHTAFPCITQHNLGCCSSLEGQPPSGICGGGGGGVVSGDCTYSCPLAYVDVPVLARLEELVDKL